MIVVDENYTIDVSDNEYTAKRIARSISKKTGEPTECQTLIGHYARLSEAIRGIYRFEARQQLESDTFTLEEALARLEKIADRIEDQLAKLKGL